jgi:hypothetical protein
MPRITVSVDDETHRKLKEKAKADKRTLIDYLAIALTRLAARK